MSSNSLIFLIFLLSVSVSSWAQGSWRQGIVYQKNRVDTLCIKLTLEDKMKLNSPPLKVRPIIEGKKYKIPTNKIDSIVVKENGEESIYKYVNITKKSKARFRVVYEGNSISLYVRDLYYSNGGGSVRNIKDYFAKRPRESKVTPLIMFRSDRTFNVRAVKYFSDCPVLMEKLKNSEYRKEDILDVVTFYDDKCSNDKTLVND